MSLYAESSAILAWLVDEDAAETVLTLLAAEPLILASDLTLIECDRALHRAVALRDLTEADAADRRAHLAGVSSHWTLLRIGAEVVERARQPFPGPPIRTLDALHLASLLVARSVVPGLTLLSLDHRVRQAAARLGIDARPLMQAP
ncbi:MAG TPA: type II toxin-antitoxin system VapC family toxin [Steroidobacteraceae bacterium]|nr:type II toxin-antitoxin system VapC family toxin [Steroidobacteraceae bacterium]